MTTATSTLLQLGEHAASCCSPCVPCDYMLTRLFLGRITVLIVLDSSKTTGALCAQQKAGCKSCTISAHAMQAHANIENSIMAGVLAVQLKAFTQWLDEEERKQEGVAAHEEPVLQSSTISARLVQLRNSFEKLNKKKKPAPPPAPKQQANTTGDAPFLLRFAAVTPRDALLNNMEASLTSCCR